MAVRQPCVEAPASCQTGRSVRSPAPPSVVSQLPTWRAVAQIGDPDGTRTMTSIVALLVAIGLALILVAVWVYRSTRPDPELLAPLEAMGERSWRRRDPVWQRRRLDELRPVGARPLTKSAAPPELDEAFDAGPSAPGFDDLADGSEHATRTERPARAASRSSDTPIEVDRPPLDAAPDGEFDPDVLAAARAELDRELAAAAHRQLDLFASDHASDDDSAEPADDAAGEQQADDDRDDRDDAATGEESIRDDSARSA